MTYKYKISLLFFFIVCFVSIGLIDSFVNNESIVKDGDIVRRFDDFITLYKKPYRKYSAEYYRRLAIFQESLERHSRLNSAEQSRSSASKAVYGINKFSDLLPAEFREIYLAEISPTNKSRRLPGKKGRGSNLELLQTNKIKTGDFPKKIDWRTENVVTAVKNQNQCGACWAYSISETVESMNAVAHGTLSTLSTQQLIDCTPNCSQCNGGNPCLTAEWLAKDKVKLASLDDYPSIATYGPCKIKCPTRGVQVKTSHCERNNLNETQSLLAPLANQGPVGVSVDAAQWQDYNNGIIKFHCSPNYINHAVQVVGYDLTGDTPYYIVRNSWGKDFGIGGYLYIAAYGNVCGIAQEVVSLEVY